LPQGGLKIYQVIRHPAVGASPEQWDLVLLGFVISSFVSFIAVRWLLRYIQTHTFVLFGWYRIAVGAGISGLLFAGH
jgi:undecaprenyl-diphosphatase